MHSHAKHGNKQKKGGGIKIMPYSITVKQGNLVSEPDATFIVNASNTKLILGSGVSMAFKRHCGIKIQEEMNLKLFHLQRKLQKGDVVMTSSGGATNFKYILHAAVMDYNQGVKHNDKSPTINDIKIALKNIELHLIEYIKGNPEAIKLALPLLGCGVGGLAKKDVIRCYKEFFEKEILFECEVIIYGYTKNDYELIKDIIC